MKKLIFNVTINKSKAFLTSEHSKEWFEKFKELSKKYFKEITPKIPNIGKSIFSFNYEFAPSYIAWYKAFEDMGVTKEKIDENIWHMNEKMTSVIPPFMMHFVGKTYFSSFKKKSAEHIKRQNENKLHPYDWQIEYREINENCFEIDIKTCPFKKLAKEFDVENLLPGICRMDYLFAHLMNNGFERTKTLGDGDDCCNCRYYMKGSCEWSPEKGFIDRK